MSHTFFFFFCFLGVFEVLDCSPSSPSPSMYASSSSTDVCSSTFSFPRGLTESVAIIMSTSSPHITKMNRNSKIQHTWWLFIHLSYDLQRRLTWWLLVFPFLLLFQFLSHDVPSLGVVLTSRSCGRLQKSHRTLLNSTNDALSSFIRHSVLHARDIHNRSTVC